MCPSLVLATGAAAAAAAAVTIAAAVTYWSHDGASAAENLAAQSSHQYTLLNFLDVRK